MTIELSTTDKRDGKALALFAAHATWQRGHLKDGRSFFAIPSGSEAGLFHMVTLQDCSCPDRQQRGSVCYHIRAARLWMTAYKSGAVSLTREAGADPADDLIILLPAGAAALVQDDATPAGTEYQRLFPVCQVAGCDDEPQGRSQVCSQHRAVAS